MWLVLCDANDMPAIWAYERLKARGIGPLELIQSEALAHGVRWEHRLSEDGVSVDITLADGRRLHNDRVRGVLNRLLFIPSESLYFIHPTDRDYITQELTAFFISWLYALPQPVLNRPTPQGLAGQWRHISEWIWLSSQAGLPTPLYRQTSRDVPQEIRIDSRLAPELAPMHTVIVIDGQVVETPAPPHIQQGCQRLAKLVKTPLIGIEFAPGPSDPWTFAGATTFPDLTLGGEACIDVLAAALGCQTETNQ